MATPPEVCERADTLVLCLFKCPSLLPVHLSLSSFLAYRLCSDLLVIQPEQWSLRCLDVLSLSGPLLGCPQFLLNKLFPCCYNLDRKR